MVRNGVLLIALLVTVGPLAAAEVETLTGRTMGTTYTVRFVRDATTDLKEIQAEIDRRLELVNDQMSTYREDSEISRFNRHAGTDWFEVSIETASVVARALEISDESDGAFDVTVAPLVNLWHFGPEEHGARLPDEDAIAAAREHTGYKKLQARVVAIELEPLLARIDPPALKKSDPKLTIDLSAIAKGYGVDVVWELFGETNCMVEIGGEVRVRGTKPNGAGWVIGIEAPVVGVRELQNLVELSDRALASSGGYRNFFEHQGKRYSHTIDPRTGRPVEHDLLAVSVLSEDCMTADALATTAMVLGPEAGYAWLAERNVPALMLVAEGDEVVEKETPGFAEVRKSLKREDEEASPWVTIIGAVVIVALAIVGLAMGVILRGKCIQGSCGGVANLPGGEGKSGCDVCENRSPECDEKPGEGE